jgi:hypothetical protein
MCVHVYVCMFRCVIAIIRHGDRTPKQKMKMKIKAGGPREPLLSLITGEVKPGKVCMCHVSKRCVYGIARKDMYVPCVKRCVYGIARKGMYVPCVKKMCVWYSQERYVCAMCQKDVCMV